MQQIKILSVIGALLGLSSAINSNLWKLDTSNVSCNTSSLQIILPQDARAYKSRFVNIFYQKQFKDVADRIRCRIEKLTKTITMTDIEKFKSVSYIDMCSLSEYNEYISDQRHRLAYMITITKEEMWIKSDLCNALNQMNLAQSPRKEWAVRVTGHDTDIILPLNATDLNQNSIDFALNLLFLATTYAAGEDTYKSLMSDENLKKVMMKITMVVYIIAVILGIVVIALLGAVLILKKKKMEKKREVEKANLLKNTANNQLDGDSVDVVY